MRDALDERVRNEDYRVVPVLLPGAREPGKKDLPRFLRRLNRVDFRGGIDDEDAYHQLVCGIRGVAAGDARGPSPRPYRENLPHSDCFVPRHEFAEAPNLLTHVFRVPYERNPYFAGRKDVLADLRARLTEKGRPAAISQGVAIRGLGGVGKTQTALEYAFRYREHYRAVVMVRAETERELLSGFAELAGVLGLAEADDLDQQAGAEAVRCWFETEGGWLLIFDNADDPELLKPFLPRHHQGHVLLTSRAHRFDMVNIRRPFSLGTLPRPDSVAFLLSRAERLDADAAERTAAAEIAEELGDLPLALEQAGAFVLEKDQRFASYLADYRQHGLELLNRGRPVVEGHPDPVATTWLMNVQAVEASAPASADLLRGCAFLAPNEVPEEILTLGGAELGPVIAGVMAADSAMVAGEILGPLVRYSLIQRDHQRATWSVHRLVQEVVKVSLGEDRELWEERVVTALGQAFPLPNSSNWPTCSRLLPHVVTAMEALERFEGAKLLCMAGLFLYQRGRYEESEPLLERSLRIYEETLGNEHPDVAAVLNNLAELYRNQGKLSQAQPLFERALRIYEKAFGDEHPYVAAALNSLANLYHGQGKLSDAEPLYERSLRIREEVHGDEHHHVAQSLNNLADLYRNQGKLSQAQPLFERALRIWEKALGNEHHQVAITLNNLANLYHAQGNLSEAEMLFERLLRIWGEAPGDEHPYVAQSLTNYALLLRATARPQEAAAMEERARTIRDRVAGREG